jgi:hypothetical protein
MDAFGVPSQPRRLLLLQHCTDAGVTAPLELQIYLFTATGFSKHHQVAHHHPCM